MSAQIPEPPVPKVAGERLFESRLPSGDVAGINIGWSKNGAAINLDPKIWLSQGFDGIRLIGSGIGETHIRCGSYDGITMIVKRHPGIVQLENCTLHAGYSRGTLIGEQNLERVLVPKFEFRVFGVHAIVPPPQPGKGRTKWLWFGYQAAWWMQDVETDATEASEHNGYLHGLAGYGCRLIRVNVAGSGAENWKIRSDATETAWGGKNLWLEIDDCNFRNWYQTWSDRGGAGVVVQGGAVNIRVQRSTFHGGQALGTIPAHLRGKCLMVSSEGSSYDIDTGKVGTGFGNGWVIVRDSAMEAKGEAPPWHNEIIRVGRNGGNQMAAKGVLIENYGGWGNNYIAQLGDIPKGKTIIRGCNTDALRSYSAGLGMDVSHEALVPDSSRLVRLSEGVER